MKLALRHDGNMFIAMQGKNHRLQTYNKLKDEQASKQLDLCTQHNNKGQPHNILHGSIESAIPENPLVGANIIWSLCHTSRVIGDFVQILGSKFWALGRLNQKYKKQFRRVPHGELAGKKWLDSIEKQKRSTAVDFLKIALNSLPWQQRSFVAMATKVGPTFCMVPLNPHPRKPPIRPKHLRSICRTS